MIALAGLVSREIGPQLDEWRFRPHDVRFRVLPFDEPTTALGSFPEWQEFFRSEAKPQDRFQDRASAVLMAVYGW